MAWTAQWNNAGVAGIKMTEDDWVASLLAFLLFIVYSFVGYVWKGKNMIDQKVKKSGK